MTMAIPNSSESSVVLSLAELADMERQRIREEEAERARIQQERARAQREQAAMAREAELARIAREESARVQREREAEQAAAHHAAIERATVEAARAEAEARIRLEADHAKRAHELALLQASMSQKRGHMPRAVAAALSFALCAGALAGLAASRRIARLEREAEPLRAAQSASLERLGEAYRDELARLDRRLAAAKSHRYGQDELAARLAAETVRATIPEAAPPDAAPTAARLRALAEAVSAFEARLRHRERIAALDQRAADLISWAEQQRRGDVGAVRTAAQRSHRDDADGAALDAYEESLDRLRETVARANGTPHASGAPGGVRNASRPVPVGQCTNPHDPLCGLDGRSL